MTAEGVSPSLEQFRNTPGLPDPSSFSFQETYGQKVEHSPRSVPRAVTASANVNPLDDWVRVDTSSASVTMTLETAVGCDGRRHWFVKTDAANSMVIDGNGSETVGGATSITRTAQYSIVGVISNGTNWDVIYAGTSSGGPNVLAAQATTSGTSKDFDVGAGASVIVLDVYELSTNGTSLLMAQLIDGGGAQVTGYTGVVSSQTGGTTVGHSTGFLLTAAQVAAGTYTGKVTLCRHGATNTWVGTSLVARTDGTLSLFTSAGGVTLDSECTGIRLTMVNGTDAFDAGASAAQWE